jgi:hypothetical protein
LLLVASIIAGVNQSPPLVVARQYLSEQQGIAPDDLLLVGQHDLSRRHDLMSKMTFEFRVKGAENSKKQVVELSQPVYFLPWRVSALREDKDKSP